MRNKGVSPVGKIVSVARSKPALVTRYRPRMIGHDLLPTYLPPLLASVTMSNDDHLSREEQGPALSPGYKPGWMGGARKEISSLGRCQLQHGGT